MPFVSEVFTKFDQACIPAGASEQQRFDMQFSFYAGAMAVVQGYDQAADMPELVGAEFVAEISNEVHAFCNGVESRAFSHRSLSEDRKEARRQLREDAKMKLQCEATNYDDESCLALLRSLKLSPDVAVALFRMVQKNAAVTNAEAMQLALVGHRAAMRAIRMAVES